MKKLYSIFSLTNAAIFLWCAVTISRRFFVSTRLMHSKFIFISVIMLFWASFSFAGVTKEIPFQSTTSVYPNVLVILDNSGSMLCPAYWNGSCGSGSLVNNLVDSGSYDSNTTYYGYFNSTKQYSNSNGQKFDEDTNGVWNGNFLNWVSMRRIDVAKKALVGGKANPRPVNKTDPHTLIGESDTTADSGGAYNFIKKHNKSNGTSNNLFPSCGSGNDCYFGLKDGYVYFDDDNQPFSGETDRLTLKVGVSGAPGGVIPDVGNQVRLGLEYFNYWSGSSQGGNIARPMGGPPIPTAFITDIENGDPETSTPLAEALHTAAGYFGTDATTGSNGPRYDNQNSRSYPTSGANSDPFDFDTQDDVYCANVFVLLITDGLPTSDGSIPDSIGDYDGDGDSKQLDDVALWAHTTDLRSGAADLTGKQTITLFTVFAFGTGADILKDAAVNGGFIDADGDNVPDPSHPSNWTTYASNPTINEWDKNADGLPDNYFEAQTGSQLENSLRSAFNAILAMNNIVTSPVVMPGAPGEGNNLYAATFIPDQEHQWQGRLIKYPLDANGFLQGISPNFTQSWDAGEILGNSCAGTCTSSSDRKIFTVESTVASGTNNIAEVNWSDLMPLLSTNVDATRTLLGYDASSDPTYENSTKKFIRFIRGIDVFDEDVDSDTTEDRWKLADVFNSGPIEVGAPPYFYDDASDNNYLTGFKTSNSSRTTTVYAGGNDGMLHAFNASTGVETWAFIPPGILGILKDMISTTANQSRSQYYVDSSPIVDDVYVGGSWKTILICGFRWGDRGYFVLDVTDPNNPSLLWAVSTDGTTVTYWDSSGTSYDYTSDANYSGYLKLGYTWSVPITGRIKVDVAGTPADKWVAILGGGYRTLEPDVDFDLTDHATGVGRQILFVDLSDGSIIERVSETSDPSGATSGAIKDDSGDGIDNSIPAPLSIIGDVDNYFQYLHFGDREGHIWKINIEGSGTPGSTDAGTATTVSSWTNCEMFDANATYTLDSVNPDNSNLSKNQANNRRYVYAQPEMTNDENGKRWIFFGTGDARNITDLYPKIKTSSSPDPDEGNIFVALRDDTPNPALGTAGCAASPYTNSDLTNVTADSDIIGPNDQGWYIHLTEAEKSFTFPTIFENVVFFTTFIPDTSDICKLGDSYLYLVNFETGGIVTASEGESSALGSTTLTAKKVHIGSGIATAPVIRGQKIQIGITGNPTEADLDTAINLGGKRTGTIITLPLPTGLGGETVNMIFWKEVS